MNTIIWEFLSATYLIRLRNKLFTKNHSNWISQTKGASMEKYYVSVTTVLVFQIGISSLTPERIFLMTELLG